MCLYKLKVCSLIPFECRENIKRSSSEEKGIFYHGHIVFFVLILFVPKINYTGNLLDILILYLSELNVYQ